MNDNELVSIRLRVREWQWIKQALMQATCKEAQVALDLGVASQARTYDRIYFQIDSAITKGYEHHN